MRSDQELQIKVYWDLGVSDGKNLNWDCNCNDMVVVGDKSVDLNEKRFVKDTV